MANGFYLGVDVGTGSVRAGLFDRTGHLRGAASHPIQIWRPQPDFAEQSSDDIWRACGRAIRATLKAARVKPSSVRGIGFDATCSLVCLDRADRPVTVSPTGRDAQNVVAWMDHRAISQANRINATRHPVLKYVGGVISPEMETPKLLWLKENLPHTWKRTARFLDLPDFLTYRATGHDVRSLCSTVCKWTYQGHRVKGWNDTYFRRIGLGDLVDEQYVRIGTTVRPMGEPIRDGLSSRSAAELGLSAGTPVGVSIIDAHAGGLGLLGARAGGRRPSPRDLEQRLALIGGTSSCHMAVSRTPRFVPGVWGPYASAMIPGFWLSEGGQSATGALIDHIIFNHAQSDALKRLAERRGTTVYEVLNQRLAGLAKQTAFPAQLTHDLHLLPYFHGNRSPRANPTLRGMVSGLRLSDTLDDLALIYLATVQAIAHGTRHIIDTMNRHGYEIRSLYACGGGTKNPTFLREHADITGCRVHLPREPEAVLLGSAILGAVAAGDFLSVLDAMSALNATGQTIEPARGRVAAFHAAKHRVFLKMYEDFICYRKFMGGTA